MTFVGCVHEVVMCTNMHSRYNIWKVTISDNALFPEVLDIATFTAGYTYLLSNIFKTLGRDLLNSATLCDKFKKTNFSRKTEFEVTAEDA